MHDFTTQEYEYLRSVPLSVSAPCVCKESALLNINIGR